MNTQFQFREVVSDDDWISLVALRNRYLTHHPLTAEELREFASHTPAHVPRRRVLMSLDGIDLAGGTAVQSRWMQDETRFEMFMSVPLDSDVELLYGAVHDHLAEWAISQGAKKLACWQQSDHLRHIAAVTERGFQSRQVNPISCLNSELFDAEQFEPLLRGFRDEGYRFLAMTGLPEWDSEGWKHKCWRIEMDVMHDVPLPEPFKETPFDDFLKEMESPQLSRESCFYAVRDGEIAGTSQVHPNRSDRTLANTGLTGVARNHRRKGLATALKAIAIGWAKQNGIKRIYTDNEQNNPMYALNLRLGFERICDWVEYVKEMRTE